MVAAGLGRFVFVVAIRIVAVRLPLAIGERGHAARFQQLHHHGRAGAGQARDDHHFVAGERGLAQHLPDFTDGGGLAPGGAALPAPPEAAAAPRPAASPAPVALPRGSGGGLLGGRGGANAGPCEGKTAMSRFSNLSVSVYSLGGASQHPGNPAGSSTDE